MQLEILHASARRRRKPLAVLFLHGICCSAQVWRPSFLDAFAEGGFDAYALSFRGHGTSEGRHRLAWTTLRDYEADLCEALSRIDQPTAIIGHSMGGAVLQEHLRRGGRPAAAVLMNSVPPYGLASASMRLFLNAPGAWGSLAMANAFGFGVVDIGQMRGVLVSDRVEPEKYRAFMAAAGDESPLVGFELQGWRPFAPEPSRTPSLPPMMVMGGDEDGLVSVSDMEATARYYGVEPILLNGMSHLPMIEPDWRRAADPVLNWLSALTATRRRAA